MSSVMEIAMKEMGQLIELAQANLKVLPGPIVNVSGYGAVGDGVTNDTVVVQNAIDYAIAHGMKAVFFPRGINGQYYVTALTSANQVVLFGDNASFVGGYIGTILQVGEGGVSQAEFVALKAETVTAINAVTGYSADPTGTTDSTTRLQTAATAATGKTLFIPPGNYLISSTLTIPANTIVMAYGARIFNTVSHMTLLSLGNGVKVFGLEVEGAGNAAYNALGIGVDIKGSYNSTLAVINYIVDVTLEDCHIHELGSYGIRAEYAKYVHVIGGRVENIGYGGILGLSVENMHVMRKTIIKGMGPGTSSNAYNVYFTRNSAIDDLIQCPRSKSCSVVNCIIEDNPLWEGLETHAGEDIQFINNTIKNVKTPIAIVSCPNAAGAQYLGAKNCKVQGNTIYGIGTGIGIVVQGAITTVGSPVEYTENVSVANNIILNAGVMGSDTTGGIVLYGTKGCTITNNTISDCYPNGVVAYHTNLGFTIEGNTIVDPQDSVVTIGACVMIRSTFNKGVISGNNLLKVKPSTADPVLNVGKQGINLVSLANNEIVIGANYNNCDIKQLGVRGQGVTFGATIGGLGSEFYAAQGTPEGVITAKIGSIYINELGGAATTLYIKQTGSGNTGWVGK